MKEPLVSIITPCYNGEKFLNRYFESIINQTYTNIELIFINDGSIDKTKDIAFSYSDKLKHKGIQYILINQNNLGQAAALNAGLRIFKGEYLTWVDSDDVMKSTCVEEKVDFLITHEEYVMVRSNGRYYNEKTGELKRISNDEINNNKSFIFEDLVLLSTYGCCGCYMIKRDIFLKIYPNKEIYNSRYGQNWQILVPVSSYGKCGYIDKDLYIVYLTENSHSRKDKNIEDEIDRWDGFTDILNNVIKISNCNQYKYLDLVKENCARNQFYYAISSKKRNLIIKYYGRLMRVGKPSVKETMLFIKYFFCGK